MKLIWNDIIEKSFEFQIFSGRLLSIILEGVFVFPEKPFGEKPDGFFYF